VIEMFEEATYNEKFEDFCPVCNRVTTFEYDYNLYDYYGQETVVDGIKTCLECGYTEQID